MPDHPLAEVFGFPPDNFSEQAIRHRAHRLCPYNNRVPNCTKDRANDPLGVCSIFTSGEELAITCPIRFRQDWLIAEDAAGFFFPPESTWTSLAEVRLKDKYNQSAGNIDIVLVSYDGQGRLVGFGSLEVQAVYISGNIRRPFAHYMENPEARHDMSWLSERNYPRPDYLSSSRKRLAPQLIYKGGILKAWGIRQAVAIHEGFYQTLPPLEEVLAEQADVAWMVYRLSYEQATGRYQLVRKRTVYTLFKPALDQITTTEPGPIEDFIGHLQEKLDERLESEENPPDAPTLDQLL